MTNVLRLSCRLVGNYYCCAATVSVAIHGEHCDGNQGAFQQHRLDERSNDGWGGVTAFEGVAIGEGKKEEEGEDKLANEW